MGNIKLFEDKKVRSEWNEQEQQWYFSIIDVIEVLTGSPRARKYWNALKTKLLGEGFEELSQNLGQLKMQSADGKFYLTDVANVKTLLRIIQSIPSPKAEPFILFRVYLMNQIWRLGTAKQTCFCFVRSVLVNDGLSKIVL